MTYQVYVLQAGYSKLVNDKYLANGTSTLIVGPKFKLIVDTLSPWDKDLLLASLEKHKVTPDEITHLVCTHGHPDHVGNNNLFVGDGVTHIVGWSIHHMDCYSDHPFKDGAVLHIDENLEVMPTPGHTLDSVSVKVKTDIGTVIVTGDLFEKEEDLLDDNIWKEAGSEDSVLQLLNRNKVLDLADYIIPGHGPMFQVPKNRSI